MRYIIVCFQPLRALSPIPPLLPPSASPSPSPFLSLRDLSLPLASPTLLPPSQPSICENVTCVRPLSHPSKQSKGEYGRRKRAVHGVIPWRGGRLRRGRSRGGRLRRGRSRGGAPPAGPLPRGALREWQVCSLRPRGLSVGAQTPTSQIPAATNPSLSADRHGLYGFQAAHSSTAHSA